MVLESETVMGSDAVSVDERKHRNALQFSVTALGHGSASTVGLRIESASDEGGGARVDGRTRCGGLGLSSPDLPSGPQPCGWRGRTCYMPSIFLSFHFSSSVLSFHFAKGVGRG